MFALIHFFFKKHHLYVVQKQTWAEKMSDDSKGGENQTTARVIALDPGVSTFLTGFNRLCRLAHGIDKVNRKIDDVSTRSARRRRLRKAVLKQHDRIRNLVADLHWKSCHYLCTNFDVILLPE